MTTPAEYHQRRRARINAAKPPDLCRCGCGAVVVHPNKYRDECRTAAQAKIYVAALERSQAERDKLAALTGSTKPKPRKRTAKIMTDAEQRRIDSEIAVREREQLVAKGYGHGPVKKLTAEEISAIAGSIPACGSIRRSFGRRELCDGFQ